MKKNLVLFVFLFLNQLTAQIEFFNKFYFDCLKSSYQMNYGISLASPKGNFKTVQELLKNNFFRINIEESTQIQSLLIHNTLGNEKAIQYINESNISKEAQDYIKLWICFYTNNTIEYNRLYIEFQKKYPLNYKPLKVKLREILNLKSVRTWNKEYNQIPNSIKSLDSLLALPNLNNEERVYFSLIKLDFLKKNNIALDKDKDNDELADQVIQLYQSNKQLFELEYLFDILENIETKKYNKIKKELKIEIFQKNNLIASEKVFKLLTLRKKYVEKA